MIDSFYLDSKKQKQTKIHQKTLFSMSVCVNSGFIAVVCFSPYFIVFLCISDYAVFITVAYNQCSYSVEHVFLSFLLFSSSEMSCLFLELCSPNNILYSQINNSSQALLETTAFPWAPASGNAWLWEQCYSLQVNASWAGRGGGGKLLMTNSCPILPYPLEKSLL